MRTHPKHFFNRPSHESRRRGFAIVVALSLMVLLTIMILGLFLLSSTHRNSGNNDVSVRQAESIAKAATATIVSDIYAEFSADTPAKAVDAVQSIYPVSKAASMVPSKTLKDPTLAGSVDFRNLIKQSAGGVSFAKSGTTNVGPIRASVVSTFTPALDKRFISADFWKKPALFAPTASLTSNQVPDWVYLARDGSNPTTFNAANRTSLNSGVVEPKFIVGRYAWQIYHLGGLLDANVALCKSSDTADGKQAKDSPFWAVASALPGGAGLGDLIATWRHPVGKTSGPSPKRLIDDWAEPNGWNKVYSDGTNTDQTFLSRQDLLAFQKQNSNLFPASLLPWFTHANFALNQSALTPPANRPKVLAKDKGGNDGFGLDDEINPSHLAARSAIPSEINTSTRPTVPVAARRFPLDRLALVFPSPPQADLVLKYFGLTYDAGSGEWTYVGDNSGSNSVVNIKRLSEVAALNREPNFFELLKGTLPLGSLGVSGIDLSWNNTSPGLGKSFDQSVNYHIVQLVANIIDQWDKDSYPTIINFNSHNVGQRKVGRFAGVEDLPRIYGAHHASYRLKQKIYDISKNPPDTRFAGTFAGPPPSEFGNIYEAIQVIQPEIWNPHTAPVTPLSDVPTKFRVTATSNQAGVYGSTARDVFCKVENSGYGGDPWTLPVPIWDKLPHGMINDFRNAGGPNFGADPGPLRWDETNAWITFQTTSDGPASFRNPYPLKSPNYPLGSNAAGPSSPNPLLNQPFGPLEPNELTFPDAPNTQAIGFIVGRVWTSDRTFGLDAGLVQHNGVSYDLQYQGAGGKWITYDSMFAEPPNNAAGDRVSTTSGGDRHSQHFCRIDPRTSRLGLFSTNRFRCWDNQWKDIGWTWLFGETAAPSDAAPNPRIHEINSGWEFWPDSLLPGWNLPKTDGWYWLYPRYLQMNLNDGNGSYIDADGVTRPAMGADATGVTGLPLATPPLTGPAISRPRILNRAFRSVAELGYVFSDVPWRQLDLSHPASANGALLDVFCLHSDPTTYESPRISRGRVNLNAAPPEVLAALFEGTAKSVIAGNTISRDDALKLGTALDQWVSSSDPTKGRLRSRSDLVGSTTATGGAFASQGFMSQISTLLPADKSIGETREAVVRALADSSDTRTWNLMIDLVAQSGELSKGAASLRQFIVRGQVHRWIFLSIDRFTGEILHQSSEYVSE